MRHTLRSALFAASFLGLGLVGCDAPAEPKKDTPPADAGKMEPKPEVKKEEPKMEPTEPKAEVKAETKTEPK
jgi:hypothetical protein